MEKGNSTANPRRPNTAKYRFFNATKVSAIPPITVLRRELDYGHSRVRRDVVFYNALRSHIYTFKSSNGLRGQVLNKWKDRLHQDALLEMASKFLDEEENGRYYWPDNERNPNYGKFQYSKDYRKIKRTLIQLVFKINQQSKWKGTGYGVGLEPEDNPAGNSSVRQEYSHPNGNAPISQPHEPARADQQDSGEPQGDNSTGIEGMPFYASLMDIPVDLQAWNEASMSTPEAPYTAQTFQFPSGNNTGASPGEADRVRGNQDRTPYAAMDRMYDAPHSPGPSVRNLPPQAQNTSQRPAPDPPSEENAHPRRPRAQASTRRTPIETDTQIPDGNTTNYPTTERGGRQRTPTRPDLSIPRPDFRQDAEDGDWQPPSLSPSTAPASIRDFGGPETAQDEAGPSHSHERALTEPLRGSYPRGNPNPQAFCYQGMPPPPTPAPNNSTGSTAGSGSGFASPVLNHELPRQTSRNQPNLNIVYTVNVSENRNVQWIPDGRFMEMSLEALEKKLPLNGTFEGLKFDLETPEIGLDRIINQGDEDSFDGMKQRFNREIAALRKKHSGSTRVLHLEIAITPFGYEGGGGGVDEDDDGMMW